jgi:hypothetical protein
VDQEPGEKIYECGMRRFELSALLYELPLLLGAMVIAYVLLGTYNLIMVRCFAGNRMAGLIMLAVLDLIGLAIVFWSASFFPRRIAVYPDRIRFKMIYKNRDIMIADLQELRPLTVSEARRALFSPGKACLSPSVRGAVLLRKARGRAWVFCPADAEKFLAAVERARREAGPAPASGQ